MWENISRELTFAKCVSKIANFKEGISWINRKFNFAEDIFAIYDQKVNLALV